MLHLGLKDKTQLKQTIYMPFEGASILITTANEITHTQS